MYFDFYLGFLFGMVGMLAFLKVLELVKQKDKKEIEYEEAKPPVIHEEHLHPVSVNVAVDLSKELFATFSSDEYKQHIITSNLKLKLMDKLWEFVEVEREYTPEWFTYRYHAKLMVCLPVRQALKVELEKEIF